MIEIHQIFEFTIDNSNSLERCIHIHFATRQCYLKKETNQIIEETKRQRKTEKETLDSYDLVVVVVVIIVRLFDGGAIAFTATATAFV